MSRRRIHISICLMLMAIAAIVTFQAYWLYNNYEEEKQNLHIQTNILFREAVYHCQAKKMNLDTSIKFRYTATDKVRVFAALQHRLRDSLPASTKNSYRIRVPQEQKLFKIVQDSVAHVEEDSIRKRQLFTTSRTGEKTVIQVLESAEAMQDSITVKEVEDQYRTMLAREKISLPFTITKFPGVQKEEFIPPDLESANEVSIGFTKPVTFRISVGNTTSYILRKLSPIILVSFLLVTITVVSFVMLFRNLMQQRKLAQLKNDFISNVTHELKTPIATVSVAIEAMKDFDVLQNPQRTREYLNISANELHRLSLLVDNVLQLSMFERKKVRFKKEAFDLVQLVQEVLDSMKLQLEKQNAHTSVELSGENFVLEADKRHIASVIYNLLDNALKYSFDNPEIGIRILDRTTFIELRIDDNGIGIPGEYKSRIFEQFFRVPNGDRHNTKGYGLGLSYVSHIVRNHQGVIELDSQPGEGSTFIIKLPFAEAPIIEYGKKRRVWKENLRV